MNPNKSEEFHLISKKICNTLRSEHYNSPEINSLIDELNAKLYKTELFVGLNDAAYLLNSLSSFIKPADEALTAKASHLMKNVIVRQIMPLSLEYTNVISWHIDCLEIEPEMILPDILHNLQCILQSNTTIAKQFKNKLIGESGLLIKFIDIDDSYSMSKNFLQLSLIVLKSIFCLLPLSEKDDAEMSAKDSETIFNISYFIIEYLMRGYKKSDDEFLYCKAVISALRVLSHVYLNHKDDEISLSELMGICQYFILYGLVKQNSKPEKIMPAQQTIAATPIKPNVKRGKKQRVRKHRNNAIESLKKEIPVSDRSLMRDVDNFENSVSKSGSNNFWLLTSDSDMSDMENSRDAKLVALKSRVRQSAANMFLVLFKITDKREILGYWFALLPDSPDANNWLLEDHSKKTLAYCAVTDPIASSRGSALSVILGLLSGSKMYLGQAEVSKRPNKSFIPFSVSLGYVVACLHKVLVGILDTERSHTVVLVALKCCAALVQVTPYHKMNDGLISDLVRNTRKFLVHREVTLQVGALITIGCVLSIDPNVDEVLQAIRKETDIKPTQGSSNKENKSSNNCDDFEEGYSDDELFDEEQSKSENIQNGTYFNTWILDICFKNMGWVFKGDEKVSCKPSPIPVILESLQVLSAIAFHHMGALLKQHIILLSDTLYDLLQQEHHDVVYQTARLISIIGDALLKLEAVNEEPPLTQCVYMWEKLLPPLSTILQSHEATSKVVVCDCIANIGEKTFKELPTRTRMMCCALLVGSCSDEEPSVRAAAVRALAMAVMYRSLREDMCFVSDCGENILRAISEPNVVVKTKAAWALGNLSDALVLNLGDVELECIDDDLLLRLLEVSVQCASDSDKVKMNVTRALGNMLRLIKEDILARNPQLKPLCETAISKLLDCSFKVSNMKVRWNACYALGNAMKNDHLYTSFSGWQKPVFSNLCLLMKECKNLKVRINSAVALRAPRTRFHYGNHFLFIWKAILEAMQNADHTDDSSEYKHKDNLTEQLCVTLSHLCCLIEQCDLAEMLDLLENSLGAKSLFLHLAQRLPPESSSCMAILQAVKYVTVDLTATSDTQSLSLAILQSIFLTFTQDS